jgi:RNA polymerase sigma-70 factor (ECF subfamily)
MSDEERRRILGKMVEAHYACLYRFAYRLSGAAVDAEDLVQQTFLAAQARLDQLRDPERARSWLMSILRNAFFKSKRRRDVQTLEDFEIADGQNGRVGPDDVDVDGEELQILLDRLPEEFRVPLILFYFQELSYKEIAGELGVPIGTVMSRLSRAKSFLRASLLTRLGDRAPARPVTESRR